MKQLGNLAIACAKRPEIFMAINNGKVTVSFMAESNRVIFCSDWDDDGKICDIIHELNFGRCRVEKMQK